MKQIRKRLTYANVMSSIAVFLVIGGGAAFAALGKNTVGTKQLKKNAVTTAKIKNNSVTTAKIKNDAVTGAKVKDGSLVGADINLSTLGTVPSAANTNTLQGHSASDFYTLGGTLPSGKTLTGAWSANDSNQPAYGAISYDLPLATAPTVHLINPGEPTPAGCSGDVTKPGAAPGNVCIFASFLFNSSYGGDFDPSTGEEGSGKYGVVVWLAPNSASHFDGTGTWAVTAP